MEELSVVSPVDEGMELYPDAPAEFVETAQTEEKGKEDPGMEEPGTEAPAEEAPDTSKAFGLEMQRVRNTERSRYEQMLQNDPAYLMGKQMIQDIIDTQGVSAEEAIKLARDNYAKAVAEREGISEGMARRLMRESAPKQTMPTPDDMAGRVRADIAQMQMYNQLPDGFNFAEAVADTAFVQLLTEMPTQLAVRLYAAEKRASTAKQDVAEKILANKQLPKQEKPQQAATPKVDYFAMSDNEFIAMDKKLQRR